MVDVISKRCAHPGCTKKPSYSTNVGSKKPEYCSQHAEAEMVNVKQKRCAHHGCTTMPTVGSEPAGPVLYQLLCRFRSRERGLDGRQTERKGHVCSLPVPSPREGYDSDRHSFSASRKRRRGGEDGDGASLREGAWHLNSTKEYGSAKAGGA